MDIQKKFSTEKEAITYAKNLSKTEDSVTVIQSRGEFFVETECWGVRSWERIVKTFDKT
jgi:hypothetical protein